MRLTCSCKKAFLGNASAVTPQETVLGIAIKPVAKNGRSLEPLRPFGPLFLSWYSQSSHICRKYKVRLWRLCTTSQLVVLFTQSCLSLPILDAQTMVGGMVYCH